MGSSREWLITISLENGDDVVLSIALDGQARGGGWRVDAADKVFEHIEAALVDFRRGDSLNAVVRTPAEPKICTAFHREVLLSWLATVLLAQDESGRATTAPTRP